MLVTAVATALLAQTALAWPHRPTGPQPWGYFTNNTIWQPPGNLTVSYPRYVELADGSILATTALSGVTPGYFPVFESKDGGASWAYVSNLTDQVNGWGMNAQPALEVLSTPLGGYPAGTILGSGNSWSENGTRIDLYASTDVARTWHFVSHIANGTAPNTTNGAHPIWEPRLLEYDGQLIAYYSDQRDPAHGQKLSHQVSTDLHNWGPVVNDVALSPYEARPGMTNIQYVPPINKWILVHETPIGNSSSYGSNYPVHYVMADTPLEFGLNPDIPLVVNNATAPNASPYIAWSPIGGEYGTILVSDADRTQVFTNQCGGDPNEWQLHATPAGAVYSRAIEIFKHRPDHLAIYGGNTYDQSAAGIQEPFSITVVNLNHVLASPAGVIPA
ncbi:hypothetical protein B0A55_06172 [Friedmanniomyces simplex]|uniref:Glycoside hydrolase family 93 protein n=1 Tax=Friedmanniomyces simplex TaxID=329884 RepID=A0A4U0XH91_9PEZI|nr:hypothetical protein B0A55_06172 [Friedmanniomyces simplex]